MDRKRAKEIWEMVKAYGDGEQLQYRKSPCKSYPDDEFCDMPSNEAVCMTFPAYDYEYRIKPKPREFWINVDTQKIRDPIPGSYIGLGWIKVREVIE